MQNSTQKQPFGTFFLLSRNFLGKHSTFQIDFLARSLPQYHFWAALLGFPDVSFCGSPALGTYTLRFKTSFGTLLAASDP